MGNFTDKIQNVVGRAVGKAVPGAGAFKDNPKFLGGKGKGRKDRTSMKPEGMRSTSVKSAKAKELERQAAAMTGGGGLRKALRKQLLKQAAAEPLETVMTSGAGQRRKGAAGTRTGRSATGGGRRKPSQPSRDSGVDSLG